jgi:hypothetical protein
MKQRKQVEPCKGVNAQSKGLGKAPHLYPILVTSILNGDNGISLCDMRKGCNICVSTLTQTCLINVSASDSLLQ